MSNSKNKIKDGINLLIVEDNPLLRDSLKMLLESLMTGINVQEADSGEDSIEKVKKNDCDIILMDYNMPPGISGAEATIIIKRIKPQIKILGLSNYDERAVVEEMMNAGANGYLLKNFKKQELSEAIKTVLSGATYYCTKIKEILHLE